MLFRRALVRSVVLGMRLEEFVYFFLRNSLDCPKAFLQKTIELFASSLELVVVIILESSPTLSDFPFKLFPFARNLVPIHDGPLASGCHRAMIWGLGPIKLFSGAQLHWTRSNRVSIAKQFSKCAKLQNLEKRLGDRKIISRPVGVQFRRVRSLICTMIHKNFIYKMEARMRAANYSKHLTRMYLEQLAVGCFEFKTAHYRTTRSL
jgi:hypothetical protein